MIVDWRGSAPEFLNRAFNSCPPTSITGLPVCLLNFVWPDMPRSISVINNIDVLTVERSAVDPGFDAPLGQSLQGSFKTFSNVQSLWAKMVYSVPRKHSSLLAPWFNQIHTFLFGGVTQNQDYTGNVCADLNGMGGGRARTATERTRFSRSSPSWPTSANRNSSRRKSPSSSSPASASSATTRDSASTAAAWAEGERIRAHAG